MIYPLYHVSSSVSVVIALFFLVALYVCMYCIFSNFLLLLGGDIRTYTCVYASSYIYIRCSCKINRIISPAQSHFNLRAPFKLSEIIWKKEKLPLRPHFNCIGCIARERTSDMYHARATQRIRQCEDVTKSMLNKTVN